MREEVAREVGVSVSTLKRWHSESLLQLPGKKVWTAAARFDAVLVTAAMDEAARVKVVVASVMRLSLEYPGNEVQPRRPNRAPG